MKLVSKKNKRILVHYKGNIVNALYQDGKVIQLDIEEKDNTSLLGNIYIGKVKNIVKNIGVAFIEIGNGVICYYPIGKNKCPYIVNSMNDKGKNKQLVAGDEILVQVEKEALKTKEPTVTSNISLTSRCFAITLDGKGSTHISNKIKDNVWKQETKALIENVKNGVLECEVEKEEMKKTVSCDLRNLSVIVRTNAYIASQEELIEDFTTLYKRIEQIMLVANHRMCYSLLYQTPPSYLTALRDTKEDLLDEIITDNNQLHEEILKFMEETHWDNKHKVRLYEDQLLSLSKLYSIETVITSALQKKVWLKSGGYLVIEYTEALTVIDVNSGKAIRGKSDLEETFYNINVEAAKEIAYQIRLRNLSGIILIDFIDLKTEEKKLALLENLKRFVSVDPTKTVVVDMTKLNLVEITRKKIKKPLHEIVPNW